MSLLLEIQQQLEVATQRVLRLERALRDHPELPSIAANLETAVRIQKDLTDQFHEAAERTGYDLCSYRAFDDLDRPIAAAAFLAIADFQRLVSVVHSALAHGRKERATIPESVSKETTFDFGYAMAGSVKVVLTVRNPKLLFESPLDNTLDLVLNLTQAKSSQDVLSYASRLGYGSINALYRLATDSAINGMGAEIEWRRGSEIRRSVVVQRQEWSKLRTTIAETTAVTTEDVVIDCSLRAADTETLRFKLLPAGLPMIRGTVAKGVINEEHRANLPSKYIAHICKTVRSRFALGKEQVTYHLTKLRKSPPVERKDGS